MTRVLLWVGLWTLIGGSAGATVGGPDEIEVLGFEPVDGKLYWLLDDSTGGPPHLRYFDLRGPTPTRVVPARSWYQMAEPAQSARLTRLRGRLQALAPAERRGATLTVEFEAQQICPDAARQPTSAAQASRWIAAWRKGAPPMDVTVCERQRVTVRWRGFTGQTRLVTGSQAVLREVWRLPAPGWAMARLRHQGKSFESGYDVDVLVLLRAG